MIKRLTGIAGALVLTIALTAFTASALAGTGNGNGTGNSRATPASQSSASAATTQGNSANAPGHTTSHGQNGHMQNSPTQPGVKPDNTTNVLHNTTAPATSNKTKLYGNGTTAGQIAIQFGFTGDLSGPGNSQPHKVIICGHSIDVHALKSHAAQQSCASTHSPQTVHVVLPSLGGVSPTSSTGVSTPTGGLLGAIATQLAAKAGVRGGVLGATAKARVRGGVLGALAAAGKGTLPFTGFPIWVAVLIGLGLMALGLGVRRHNARATI